MADILRGDLVVILTGAFQGYLGKVVSIDGKRLRIDLGVRDSMEFRHSEVLRIKGTFRQEEEQHD